MRTFLSLSLLLFIALPNHADGQIFGRPMMPRLQCTLRMAFFGFDIGSFEEYGKFFKDDSVMTLAEAGYYTGADSIEEYVKFVFNEFSPYFDVGDTLDDQLTFLGYDDDEGNCIFLLTNHINYVTNPINTNEANGHEVINMVKLFFNYRERYIPTINVYYTKDYLEKLFGLFSGPNTARYVCGVKDGFCSDFIDETVDNCEERLLALPVANDDVRVDGNSIGCRALHAVFASTNSEHCPHLSFEGQMDVNDKLKCQISSGIEPKDLFGEEEFEIFRAYAAEKGFDPEIAHTIT